MELAGAHVVVTGASRGIGRHLVNTLIDRGARLAVVARSRTLLESLAEQYGDDRVAAFPCDLGDATAIDGLIARIEAGRGPVDGLVNNAGVEHTGGFVAMTAADLRSVIDVNLVAPAELCRQVLPGMIARRRGHITNVSSIGGSLASAGLSVYCATKAGVNQLTAGLRSELKGTGVGTTLVEIGTVATEMMDSVRGYGPAAASVRRLERTGLSPELDPAIVAVAVVAAIESGRRHVRLPRRQAPMSMLAEAPRRVAEILTLGLPGA
ncbi:MAG: SDR family NAD(P)-dependent oxidoreductase [Acidimicrobiia bacterium]